MNFLVLYNNCYVCIKNCGLPHSSTKNREIKSASGPALDMAMFPALIIITDKLNCHYLFDFIQFSCYDKLNLEQVLE